MRGRQRDEFFSPLARSCATAKGRCWDTCFYRALSPTTANHRTKSTGVTNGFVEIKAARIVPQAPAQPLKRGWEGPKNLSAVASTKSYSVSTEPIFEISRPSCGLQGAPVLQGGPGPLEVRCHQKIPIDPIGDERAEGGSFLRRIRCVSRDQVQPDGRGRQDVWSAKRPLRGPPGPRIRNWSQLASRSVVADQRTRRSVPENMLSIPQPVHRPHCPPPLPVAVPAPTAGRHCYYNSLSSPPISHGRRCRRWHARTVGHNGGNLWIGIQPTEQNGRILLIGKKRQGVVTRRRFLSLSFPGTKQKSRVECCNRDRDSNCCHRNFSLALVRRSLPQGSPHVSKSCKVSTIFAIMSGTGTRRQCPESGQSRRICDALDPTGQQSWCCTANQKMPHRLRADGAVRHRTTTIVHRKSQTN